MTQATVKKGKRRITNARGTSIALARRSGSPDPNNDSEVRRWLQSVPRPWAVDMYAGAGGLSLGLNQAGFSVVAAADRDARSLETHSHNIGGLSWHGDLSDPEEFISQLTRWGIRKVDLVAGGPPCQPFSHAGTPKIADLVRRGVRSPVDGRASLWKSFLDVIDHLDARAVLIENVPGFARIQSGYTLTTLLSELEKRGYCADVRELKSWRYGVPQLRKRLIVVALHESREFPWPPESDVKPSVSQAIGDLPIVSGGQREEILPYSGEGIGTYAQRMRSSLDESEREIIRDHITRFVRDDDAEIFACMEPGQTYRDVPEHLRRYRADTFSDKYKRLTWEGLSRTITAHIAKDGYWYIHPEQDRTLSVREAARIQTFPDSFRFAGTPSNRYQQIGNAVPPMLAESVGTSLRESLESKEVREATTAYHSPSVREVLIPWYLEKRRPYIWRSELNPWYILLAEICLRRTRADQVAQRFPALLKLAPSPESLIENQEKVREELSHLGIMGRVDDLIKMAATLVEEYGGGGGRCQKPMVI